MRGTEEKDRCRSEQQEKKGRDEIKGNSADYFESRDQGREGSRRVRSASRLDAPDSSDRVMRRAGVICVNAAQLLFLQCQQPGPVT